MGLKLEVNMFSLFWKLFNSEMLFSVFQTIISLQNNNIIQFYVNKVKSRLRWCVTVPYLHVRMVRVGEAGPGLWVRVACRSHAS